jgi:hypothetical protein
MGIFNQDTQMVLGNDDTVVKLHESELFDSSEGSDNSIIKRFSAIHAAARNFNHERISELLSANIVLINSLDQSKRTPLHAVLENGTFINSSLNTLFNLMLTFGIFRMLISCRVFGTLK